MSFKLTFKECPPSQGRIRYAHVPWDSEIFGVEFYQLELTGGEDDWSVFLRETIRTIVTQSEGTCIIVTKVPVSAVGAIDDLVQAGFYPVETMLEPYRDLRSFQETRSFERLRLRPATEADRPRLLQISRTAFTNDRFHLDPRLSDERASYRYEYWLDKGLAAGDGVYAYVDTAKRSVLGFCHVREVEQGVVDFSLGAIDPAAQKVGFGALMYSACLAECRRQGYRRVVTHISLANMAVLNIFAHLGFSFRNPIVTLHRHERSAQGVVCH